MAPKTAQVTVMLTKADKDALVKMAEREYREPGQQAAMLIRRGLGQSSEWTTELPTEPGWYWVRVRRKNALEKFPNSWHISLACIIDSNIYVHAPGYITEDKDVITHWLGPLPVPAAPLKE